MTELNFSLFNCSYIGFYLLIIINFAVLNLVVYIHTYIVDIKFLLNIFIYLLYMILFFMQNILS